MLDRIEKEFYSEKVMRRINNQSAAEIYSEAKKHPMWRQSYPGLVKDPIALHPVFRQFTPLRPVRFDQFCAEIDMQRIHARYDAILAEYQQMLAWIDRQQAALADLDRQYAEMLAEIVTLRQAA